MIGAGLAAMPMLPAGAQPSDPDPAASSPIKETSARDKLGQADRDLLAEAVADGDKTVTLILATKTGEAGDVAASVEDLGGTVGKRVDRIGYVRATVPTKSVTKAAGLADVLKVDLNSTIELDDPSVDRGRRRGDLGRARCQHAGRQPVHADPARPAAVAFKKAHPTWDGRGVTIGVLDSGVDLDHPALQKTSTGERKIVDWVTATDPLLEGDGTWRAMLTDVTGPTFTLPAARTWTAPAGNYTINRFTREHHRGQRARRRRQPRRRHHRPLRRALRPDDPRHLGRRQPEPRLHRRREDASLQGEVRRRPLRHGQPGDRRRRRAHAVRRRVPRGRRPRPRPACRASADFVNIGIIEAPHGTHVAGITAANDMFGGATSTARRPAPRSSPSRACSWGGGCTAAALTDGMVDLVANRGVDVVNMSIGGLPALNDGNNARAELYDRADRRLRRAAVHLGRQQRPGSEHHRRPVRGHRRRQRRRHRSARRPGWPTTAPVVSTPLNAAQLLLARSA